MDFNGLWSIGVSHDDFLFILRFQAHGATEALLPIKAEPGQWTLETFSNIQTSRKEHIGELSRFVSAWSQAWIRKQIRTSEEVCTTTSSSNSDFQLCFHENEDPKPPELDPKIHWKHRDQLEISALNPAASPLEPWRTGASCCHGCQVVLGHVPW